MWRGRRPWPAGRRKGSRMGRRKGGAPDDDGPGWRWWRWRHDHGWRGYKAHRGRHDVRSGRRGSDLHIQAAVAAGHIPRATKVEVAHAEAGRFGFGAQGPGAHEQHRGCTEHDLVHIT